MTTRIETHPRGRPARGRGGGRRWSMTTRIETPPAFFRPGASLPRQVLFYDNKDRKLRPAGELTGTRCWRQAFVHDNKDRNRLHGPPHQQPPVAAGVGP